MPEVTVVISRLSACRVDTARVPCALGAVLNRGMAVPGAARLYHGDMSGCPHLAEQRDQSNEPTAGDKSGHGRSVAFCRRCGISTPPHSAWRCGQQRLLSRSYVRVTASAAANLSAKRVRSCQSVSS
jgi:hypothetical protein